MFIREIKSREILDSRGVPTLETQTTLSDGSVGVASVPSGASTGSLEALEMRDKDYSRFDGNGVLRAIENVNQVIAPHLYKRDPNDQIEVDKILNAVDGTSNKSHLGANSILSVSLSVARAVATAQKIPLYQRIHSIYQLVNNTMFKKADEAGIEIPATRKMSMPTPMFNLINGGQHADNDITFQEFLLIPNGINSFSEQLRLGAEVWHNLKKLLLKYGYTTGLGDEGGFAPILSGGSYAPNADSDEKAIEMILEAIEGSGKQLREHVSVGLDVAAGTFYSEDKLYHIPEEKRHLTSEEMTQYIGELVHKYKLLSVEDPLSEEDPNAWTKLTDQLKNDTLIIGDDLFATDLFRLEKGVQENKANAIIIKPNQIGTLVESLETVIYAQQHNYKVVVAHRSGETNDSFIADLAVGVGAEFIKAGSPARGERVAKYNRLLKISPNIDKESAA